jgi:HSP20 family molecular chaperone IbpA
MSLTTRFPTLLRPRLLEIDNWFHPSFDLFDPFDDFNRHFDRNFFWIRRPLIFDPPMLTFEQPKQPEKYRINIDCTGYSPKALTVEYKGDKLNVIGREEVKISDNDYSIKEFKKSYKLPENAEHDKMASYYTNGQLVVEVPLKSEQKSITQNLTPQITDGKISLNCSVPKGIDPSKVSVTCSDRDLIIKAEDKIEKADGVSSSYYYKRCRLPENADLNAIECSLEDSNLAITAPVKNLSEIRHIPVQHK